MTPNKGFPRDYHNYVFRDGRFIGDFDNMYRYSNPVPWEQDKQCHDWYIDVGMAMLRDRAPYGSILEIGCGLGYIAARIKPLLGDSPGTFDAFDISPDAIQKALQIHPGISFYVDDVMKDSFVPRRSYKLVVIREIFWYTYVKMDNVIRNIDACIARDGWLYICQAFPSIDTAFVGKETLPDPDALLAHFRHYEPVYTVILRQHERIGDGPMLHLLARKRA